MTTSVKQKCPGRKVCTFADELPSSKSATPTVAGLTGKCRTGSFTVSNSKSADFAKLIKYIDDNIVGKHATFLGPYGRRKIVYCDYTASGRALHFVEDYILKEVLPLYSSSVTSTNVTALQSALYRQEAHDIVHSAVHASNDDTVVFAGNGCNGALRNLIYALELEEPPVVFVGSSEPDSVLQLWTEMAARICRVAETKEGFLDLTDLERKLKTERQLLNSIGSRAQFIGCFSAASNVTGILADDIATTILLHQYGALSFWDYGTAAPYVPLDMNPVMPGNDEGVYKDAVFFSGHKFVGGVQSSGVLVAKKRLFRCDSLEERSSNGSDGGNETVYVPPYQTRLQDFARQESGSGAVVGCVRMGLAMHLKSTLGAPNVLTREQKITKTVLSFLRTIPEIILLGNGSHNVKRLPIFSFMVRHSRGTYLHHNFVCAVLNDVFGIQARGGCTCAGSYVYDLLGIDEKLTACYEELLTSDHKKIKCDSSYKTYSDCLFEMMRPGFVRISLPYFMSDAEIAFILEAVKMVATEGWKLLPQYILYPETAEWKHRTNIVFRERKWLNSFRFVEGRMTTNERKISGQSPFPQDPSDCLQMARNIFNKARKMAHRYPLSDQRVMFDEKTDKLRWFILPSEAQDLLLGHSQNVKTSVPFEPGEYGGAKNRTRDWESSSCVALRHDSSLLDVDSMYGRHNSLTSFEMNQLKRCTSLFRDKANSDCCCLSPFRSSFRREASPMSRTRCYSLESSSTSPPSRLLMAMEGHCSCGSQTDISDNESAKDVHASADFSDFGDMGITNLFPASENENIEAYVKGVTEELASEIKTEIREVIATVDNVLSENADESAGQSVEKRFVGGGGDFRRTSSTPMLSNASSAVYCYTPAAGSNNGVCNGRQRISSYECHKNAPPSAAETQPNNVGDHVAVYLAELTTEMVTEMKSEIRSMVNAVDEIISPSMGDKSYSSSVESVRPSRKNRLTAKTASGEWDDSDESQSQNESSCSNSKTEDMAVETKLKGNETAEAKSLSKSDSSSDSGVAEISSIVGSPTKLCRRKISVIARDAKSSPNVNDDILEAQLNVEFRMGDRDEAVDKRKCSYENAILQPKWHCPPKSVWKPTVEAIREYDMIREGDRVLVCLSGGKDSLSLLHTLHQYQYYSQSYGVTFTFGAITIDTGRSIHDPRPLIPYLHALGVQYFYEELKTTENAATTEDSFTSLCDFRSSSSKRNLLYKTARVNNYNVLALGQHFDDVAEDFLMSVFHVGRLHSIKAHHFVNGGDLRVVRPFIYVREKHLRQFTENRKLPVIVESYSSYLRILKEKQRTKQLLAQQEILHPKLFNNLKLALQPLMGSQVASKEKAAGGVYRKGNYSDENDSPVFVISDTDEEEEDAV